MKDNKLILSHSGEVTLKDGTDLIVTIESYEKSLFPLQEMHTQLKVEYKRRKELRYMCFFPNITTKELAEKDVNFTISEIEKDNNNYKFQHASK